MSNFEKVFLSVILIYSGYVISVSVSNILNVLNFHDEFQNLYRYRYDWNNEAGYLSRYHSASATPLLYLYGSEFLTWLGLELESLHRAIALSCMFCFIMSGAIAAHRYLSWTGVVIVTAFLLTQPIYSYQITSATTHAFAFPLLMLGLCCLINNKEHLLAFLVVLSGLLYLPVTPVLGLALFLHIVWRRKTYGTDWRKWQNSALLLSVVGAISIALLIRQILPITGFGEAIAPNTLTNVYPENGEDGRIFAGWSQPLVFTISRLTWGLQEYLNDDVAVTAGAFIWIVALYGLLQLRTSENAAPIYIFVLSFGSIFIAGYIVQPGASYRLFLYQVHVVIPLLFTYGIFIFTKKVIKSTFYSKLVSYLMLLVILFNPSGVDTVRSGFQYQFDEQDMEMLDYLKSQPKSELVAGWTSHSAVSFVPYIARKHLFLSMKAHYTTHVDYIIELRARTYALIDAYLADKEYPVYQLKCRWGVNILVVNRSHFKPDSDPIFHFAPFHLRIREKLRGVSPDKLFLANPPESAITFANDRFYVLDLDKLPVPKQHGGKKEC